MLQMQNYRQLNEGLRTYDLEEMVYPTFEVDAYRSKMGEDRDVCVISFTAKDRAPARDLMEFIEKGYSFVLDADISSGENENGEYSVFVELKRTPNLAEQIKELTYGVFKLTNINEWKFKYHKNSQIYEASEDTLSNVIPLTPQHYDGLLLKVKTESVKHFFSKTLMDDLTIDGNIITIHKPFGQTVQLEWLSEDDPQAVLEGAASLDTNAMGEIFWLTKVLGDYNINKYQDKFLFTNGDKAMLLKRTA
jgi:hypothetical protein